MDESNEFEELGRYIQQRLRAKGITDIEVAKALSLSEKTVQKIYPLKDMYSERLSIFCKLLQENIFVDYYGKNEPLRTILNEEVVSLRSTLKLNEEMLDLQRKYINEIEEKIKNFEKK